MESGLEAMLFGSNGVKEAKWSRNTTGAGDILQVDCKVMLTGLGLELASMGLCGEGHVRRGWHQGPKPRDGRGQRHRHRKCSGDDWRPRNVKWTLIDS